MRERIAAPDVWKEPVERIARKGFELWVLAWRFINPLGSTIIVVIRTGDSVIVAADSRRTNATGQLINDSTCKIKAIGNNHFVASAGATRSLGLINPNLVSKGLTDSDAIAAALERHLMPVLRTMSEEILSHPDRKTLPYTRYAHGASLLSFVVVGKTATNHIGWAMRDFSTWSASAGS